MPGAVATATTANTSATPPIPSTVGQNCRNLDAAVMLLVLAFVTSWEPAHPFPGMFSAPPGPCSFGGNPSALAVSLRLRLSVQSGQALRTVPRVCQLQRVA